MKRILLAISALGVVCFNAEAADLAARPYTKAPPVAAAPVNNWTGFYVGAHAGYGWGDATNEVPLGFFLGDPNFPWQDMKGALAGGQLGVNYQINQFVFGVEGDGSWTDIHQHSVTSIFPPNTTTNDGRAEWVASIRGRVGVAFDSLLIYGTGGAAWASLKLSEQTLFNPGAIVARNLADSSGIVHDGWVAGGGIEWMFAPNWMARAEYLHYEFDSKLHFNPNPLFGIPTDLKMDVARAGVSYKFGWAASSVAAKY